MKKVLFVIGFRFFVLNYTCMHDVLLFLIKQLNYIWFINIISNIMHKDSHVILLRALVIFCSMRPLVASGVQTEIMPFKCKRNLNIDNNNLVYQPF